MENKIVVTHLRDSEDTYRKVDIYTHESLDDDIIHEILDKYGDENIIDSYIIEKQLI